MKQIIISPKQQETLDFIKKYVVTSGESPTITELRIGLGLKSLRSVTQRIESLEAKGLLKRNRFQHRGISIIEEGQNPLGLIQIPVIASAGCDAKTIYAQKCYDEFLMVDKKLTKNKPNVVVIKALGNSMIDAGIKNGDYVLTEVTDDVSSGDRVVAILGDMAVIKKLKITPTATILEPESKDGGYHPIIISEENSKIFGKVISIIPMSKVEDDYQIIYDPGMDPKQQNNGFTNY
jgi:repressor LexA